MLFERCCTIQHMRRRGRYTALVIVLGALVGAVVATAATIRGTAQADVLRGTARADVIYGRGGNDRIFGYAGSDRIYPGLGTDTVFCGAGVDRVFADKKDKTARDCEIVTRPTKPTPPITPPPPPPAVGTRENPYPIGSAVDLGDGWRMKVEGSTPDATAAVLATNPYNDPPQAGNQFFIARVTATYTGSGSSTFRGTFRLRAVGASAVSYSTFSNYCGVVPDPISDAEVFTGGTITGNVCWQIRSVDASSLVVFDEPIQSVPKRLFFALR